jgi:bifunctional non-homologous end joining protein LigD
VQGHGGAFFEQACALHLEGIVAKRADAPYRSTRSRDWLKVKCQQRQEFVIGGYTVPRGARTGFGALLVGYRNADGDLVYAGRVGTGFDERTLRTLTARLEARRRATPPFTRGPLPKQAAWVVPELVAEVRFAEWTRDGVLRMPAFLGLREDKPAQEVGRERPAPPTAPTVPDPSPPPGGALPDRIAGLRLSNPDKVLYPAQGLTKRDLARYYEAVGDRLLPELVRRPLTLLRCPEGRHRPCFFQKHAMPGLPPGLHPVAIPEKGKAEEYLYLDSLDGVIGLVQLGVLEIHTWGARVDQVERPDRVVFDLDPDEGLPWGRVIEAAHHLRDLLGDLGLQGFPRTTGGKGLHVVVPIARRHGWDEVKAFAKAVVARLAREAPHAYTISPVKRSRAGKLFLDYLRNGRGATAIASYSTRAREGAPVAVNLAWDEVTEALRPASFTVTSVPIRLRELTTDPWQDIGQVNQSITRDAQHRLGL